VTKEEDDSKLTVKYKLSEDSTHNTSEQDDDASVKLSDDLDIESHEILSPETSLRMKQEGFKSRISQEE